MTEAVLLESRDGGILFLTTNRPAALNALDPSLARALRRSIAAAAEDPSVAVLVLRGSGRAFCAGGDISSMKASEEGFEGKLASLRSDMEAARLLHDMPKPTIAMLRGAVAGAGLGLALACDIRIASPTLKMLTAFSRVGLSGDNGGSYFLTRLVGTARARHLYFTSPTLDAQKALELGLVTGVEADGDLEDAVRDLARALDSGPRIALSYIKQTMNLAETASLAEVMEVEALRHTHCRETEDHREAATAFAEKRTPRFAGR